MRFFLIFIFCYAFSFSDIIDNSFITNYEYGKMLYKNPRGIGCIKCHGKSGDSKLIAKYKNEDGIEEMLIAPPINELAKEKFFDKLKNKEKTSLVMPTYFLTDHEINSIYIYITKRKKQN